MTDPLSLVPYALAAGGGRIGPHEVTALVAAGTTLLQRSAPLVRVLAGRRSALLLAADASWLVALAASDGRGAVLLDPEAPAAPLAEQLAAWNVGAVFTTAALAGKLPATMPRVLFDAAPHRAHVVVGDRDQQVDLGSHFGLDLMGDTTSPGRDEECLVVLSPSPLLLTHREILASARTAVERTPFTPVHRTALPPVVLSSEAVVDRVIAPLLAGGTLLPVGD